MNRTHRDILHAKIPGGAPRAMGHVHDENGGGHGADGDQGVSRDVSGRL